jgi:hypothetical protein
MIFIISDSLFSFFSSLSTIVSVATLPRQVLRERHGHLLVYRCRGPKGNRHPTWKQEGRSSSQPAARARTVLSNAVPVLDVHDGAAVAPWRLIVTNRKVKL